MICFNCPSASSDPVLFDCHALFLPYKNHWQTRYIIWQGLSLSFYYTLTAYYLNFLLGARRAKTPDNN